LPLASKGWEGKRKAKHALESEDLAKNMCPTVTFKPADRFKRVKNRDDP